MTTIEVVDPSSPVAAQIVRAYMADVASRYYGRPATTAEIDKALLDEPFDDLAGPSGVLLVALRDGEPVACAGARFVDDTAELTKVFTTASARGSGLARRLVATLEQMFAERGLRTVRLDTRSDLVEACALYESIGYRRVEPFNDEPYSDRWYAKRLTH
ncbi:acetyltransferase (GNAT) family protein [Flavimobilis soli]|uniref:Acetyltransferase (GNAT) family protein n=1 Tax=Flavimobilis soli TaxID=442709 RepID=A0A2A9E9U7_9MICO|nr:acetyltransferase (GNAT) family protein [Flavimobilis soli]